MIAAVLTTVVALLALAAINIFKSQSENRFKSLEESIHSLEFYSTFYTDMTKSGIISREEQSILLSFPEYDLIYLFDESKAVRKMLIEDFEKTDTFYLNNLIVEGKNRQESSLIPNEHIKINWTQNGLPKSISIAKEYSAEELMNFENGNKYK